MCSATASCTFSVSHPAIRGGEKEAADHRACLPLPPLPPPTRRGDPDALDEGAAEGFHRAVAGPFRQFAQLPVRVEQGVADGQPDVAVDPFVGRQPRQHFQAARQLGGCHAEQPGVEGRGVLHVPVERRREEVKKFDSRPFVVEDAFLCPQPKLLLRRLPALQDGICIF